MITFFKVIVRFFYFTKMSEILGRKRWSNVGAGHLVPHVVTHIGNA